MKLMFRSLLVALVLLGGYSLLLKKMPTSVVIPQGVNQDNLIKMQQYVYGQPEAYSSVIVGSSLSAKLRAYALPPHTYNLAFRGQSVFEGLDILRHTGQVPRLLLVEMDVLDRAPNASTIATLFHPVMHPLRQQVPAFQEQNQPLNQLFGLGFRVLERLRPAATGRIREKIGVYAAGGGPQQLPEAPASAQDAALARKIEDDMRLDFAQLPDTAVFTRNVQVLRSHLRYFASHGSQIVFFEMPISAVACQSNKLNYMRQQLLAAFPSPRFAYLPQPDCQAYTTTDGMHLSDASALRYSHELNRQMAVLNTVSYVK